MAQGSGLSHSDRLETSCSHSASSWLLPGPALLPLGVEEASARCRAPSDALGPLAEEKACVSFTTWRRLPFLSLLFSTCLLVPRRKQAHSSYLHRPVLERPVEKPG